MSSMLVEKLLQLLLCCRFDPGLSKFSQPFLVEIVLSVHTQCAEAMFGDDGENPRVS